jgi:hypothetical protein
MKKPEIILNRLFDAARLARSSDDNAVMPGYLQAAVLRGWRRGWASLPVAPSLIIVFRRALMCATLVMLASIAWAFSALTHPPENDVAIANFELRFDVMP